MAEENEAVGTGNEDRVAALNKIGLESENARAEEFMGVGENDTLVPFEPSEESTSEVESAPIEETTAAVEEPATPQTYRVKVNGQELELSLEELIARAQKVEAADQYLNQAADLYRQASEAANGPAPTEAVEENKEEEDLALARAIQMGSEEEAVAAIRKLRVARPSQDVIARTIDERLSFQTAYQQFQKEFKDIVGDPRLNRMAQEMDAELISKGDRRSYAERYTEIGKSLRDWVGGLAPKPDVAAPSEKQARKDAAPAVPKAATGRAEAATEEEDEETIQQVIANMAKARGGPQWMRS